MVAEERIQELEKRIVALEKLFIKQAGFNTTMTKTVARIIKIVEPKDLGFKDNVKLN